MFSPRPTQTLIWEAAEPAVARTNILAFLFFAQNQKILIIFDFLIKHHVFLIIFDQKNKNTQKN